MMRSSISIAAVVGIGRQVVDVELEGVGAGLLDEAWRGRASRPDGDAVQRADHRECDRLLILRICSRYSSAPARNSPARESRWSPRRRPRRGLVEWCRVAEACSLRDELLLEQRAHDDRRGAGVLEPADRVQVVDQGEAPGMNGWGKLAGRGRWWRDPWPALLATPSSCGRSALAVFLFGMPAGSLLGQLLVDRHATIRPALWPSRKPSGKRLASRASRPSGKRVSLRMYSLTESKR